MGECVCHWEVLHREKNSQMENRKATCGSTVGFRRDRHNTIQEMHQQRRLCPEPDGCPPHSAPKPFVILWRATRWVAASQPHAPHTVIGPIHRLRQFDSPGLVCRMLNPVTRYLTAREMNVDCRTFAVDRSSSSSTCFMSLINDVTQRCCANCSAETLLNIIIIIDVDLSRSFTSTRAAVSCSLNGCWPDRRAVYLSSVLEPWLSWSSDMIMTL
jgi:hypothetical protein